MEFHQTYRVYHMKILSKVLIRLYIDLMTILVRMVLLARPRFRASLNNGPEDICLLLYIYYISIVVKLIMVINISQSEYLVYIHYEVPARPFALCRYLSNSHHTVQNQPPPISNFVHAIYCRLNLTKVMCRYYMYMYNDNVHVCV